MTIDALTGVLVIPAIAAARATWGKAVEPAGSKTIASGRGPD